MIGKQRIAFISLLGLLLACLGLIYIINLERLQRYAMKWFMVLRPNTMMSNLWENPSLKMTANLYIFNWTNPEQFKEGNVKARFEELGPYVFTEQIKKINISWHPENSTVSYSRLSSFYFDEAASVGKLNDIVVAPNSVSVGLYNKVQNWSPMIRTLMIMALSVDGNKPTFVRPANDWLFGGFDTPLIKISKMVPSSVLPELHFPYERIGYGYPRNGSTEIYGRHNVYTGEQDFSKVGQIARWRYGNVSDAYPNCPLRGSLGEFHPTPLRPGEPISYFLPDLCRELQVDFDSITTFEGITAYVYRGSARNFANGTDNPANSCYASEDSKDLRSGLLNVSSCWYDVPVFASYPHYYKADPYYVEAVEGMQPDKERHEMMVILEPRTGMLLDIKARLMVSLLVEPRPESIFRKARRTYFPLVWADYRVRITPDLLFYLHMMNVMDVIGKIFGTAVIVLGLALLLWYPRRILLQKHFMHKIDITNPNHSTPGELKGHVVEGSPLLVGSHCGDSSPALECGS